jgi:steroid delta-isomerase-like uncharacterized protein
MSTQENKTIQENKTVAQRWTEEVWNKGNWAVAGELLHPDYVWEDRSPGKGSLEAIKETYAFWHQVLPDLHFTIDEMIAEGNTVVARWTVRGTHQGEWVTPIGTVPATGKPTVTIGTTTYHFKDGKIIRDIGQADLLSTLQQTGAVIRAGETTLV